MELDRHFRTTDTAAAEMVVNFVRSQIERGQLKPGDRLPSERDMATRVGVSRPSVRAGLRTLVGHGRRADAPWLRHLHHRRPTAHSTPSRCGCWPRCMASARSRCSSHGACSKPVIAALAAERATSDHLASMAEEVTGMFASVDDPQTFLMHDVRFHRAIAAASGNPILASLVEMISTLYFEHRRRTTRTREQLRDVAIMHRNIYHAVRAHDPERARREMNTHLPRLRPAASPDAPSSAGLSARSRPRFGWPCLRVKSKSPKVQKSQRRSKGQLNRRSNGQKV